MRRQPDLAVFVASLFHGGVGKMRVHLINEMARQGHRVELLLADRDSPYMNLVSPEIRVVHVGTSNAVTGIPAIALYLLRARPRVMLAQRVRVNVLSLRARTLTRARTRMFVTVNTNMSRELAALKPQKHARHLHLLKKYYPHNDGIIAVSHGVAADLSRLIGIPLRHIDVAPNPTVTPELERMAAEPLDDPWFASGEPPVIVGMGRLEPQKDFPTLLRAFAILRRKRRCRLIVLGEGKERESLLRQATELGIAEDVRFPGFVKNPYAYLSRAALFALSSAWEGSPNSLTEALALGTPLVSTDCPDGPREILENGHHGPLVPVGDADALAAAMTTTLERPPDRRQLQAAAQRYTLQRSATAYLRALGLSSD
ncbi:glycosyl transferase [Sulfurifustis variabilis]|uniref:Glycosyl transferase n=1 Tax=Sulfurifustis variabilis TaxID=1675686 RepID=A0A1B4VC05_9GAMM|nr:glycosyltransferase [Sulfurifustis variabilis]BAU50344.1 glycosyl transferase [Sulfurifustis variabilis]